MFLAVTWKEICADPSLRDLPYKVETNRRDQLVLSPRPARHGEMRAVIGLLLGRAQLSDRVVLGCPVQTVAGVCVPDVVWTSPERRQSVIYTLAPEICIEVLAPYNDDEEMAEKRALYFAAGALEAWICAEDGLMAFHGPAGRLERSALCPDFPARVEI